MLVGVSAQDTRFSIFTGDVVEGCSLFPPCTNFHSHLTFFVMKPRSGWSIRRERTRALNYVLLMLIDIQRKHVRYGIIQQ